MRALVLLIVLVAPTVAFAHAGDGSADETGWTFALWLTLPLVLSALLWSIGFIRRVHRSHSGKPLLWQEARWFALAWLILALAVLSPLHAAGERSFTMHMIEHEIIMMVAAPLFALARPLPTMLWGFSQPWRGWVGGAAACTAPLWRLITAPVFATIAQAAALWLWHAPSLFDLALGSDFWHAAQHLSFFVTALIFWTAMLDARRAIGLRALCLFATSIVSGALGALMAFSESPWYEPYALLGMTPQGLTPAEDQQLAGVLMWVPGGFVHAGAALALLAPFLRADEGARRSS
jgi:cytochrome c oxidase assembly factor CtaG